MSQFFLEPWQHYSQFCKAVNTDAGRSEGYFIKALGMHRHPIVLNFLARALMDKYKKSGNKSLLEENIALSREALDMMDGNPAPHSTSLHNLGSGLQHMGKGKN
ncbi:hypothetical protein BT96DRAFT_948697 [Gymnopus androsaceus JB14]|uniref:Uncharacterized protein n=1 Tax=Gymnopus androsaceus JB14 TaxID=1447944 RepID=A0A6A4GP53_9AGAR|nr:hypothetical protein BT96DRAFT_948697 [Gymnopus androsaceus JB14]